MAARPISTSLGRPQPGSRDDASLLSPVAYDDDASSLHSRSDQDTDSDDDELQMRARDSKELRAHDRIMLMEEEEVEKLVTKSRHRRPQGGSGFNPLSMFSRKKRGAIDTPSNTSSDDVTTEKRRSRLARRHEKRERLKEQAEHGEDGELMYEMEEGGMKDGSSTGESSEDLDEIDRARLNSIASAKSGWSWRRWVLISTAIAALFAILFVAAWRISVAQKASFSVAGKILSNGTALFGPTTVIISLDGFRADFLQRGLTQRLNAFIKEGVSPKYMLPSFPSVTFPNHYTIATGLYPESHGVVGNTFFDPKLGTDFYYTDPKRSLDPKWWMGEPFWVTAEKQGVRTAIHMWPGSEAHILGIEPSFLDEYNGAEALPKKVDRLFEFLDKPGKEDETADEKDTRPQVIAMYVPNVDAVGHKYGPNSTEIESTIREVDGMLDQIFTGLEQRNLTNIVNIIVVSDHGMATTDVSRLIQLEDLVDLDLVAHTDGWPLVGLRPKKPEDLKTLYDQATENAKGNPNIEVYLRDVNMPERYHFSNNDRIAPLWIVPKAGWGVVDKLEMVVADAVSKGEVYHPRGMHGYDHEHPLMRAIFVARGPAFPHPPNSRIDPFQNIEVYNMLCDSVGIIPASNNGTMRLPLRPLGLHGADDFAEPVYDPTPTAGGGTTKLIGVDPVDPSDPVSSVLDKETGTGATAATTAPAAPAGEGETGEGETTEKEDEEEIDEAESKIKGLWDWITEKIGGIWDKVSGSS
ncbi:related to nucleotide diphosphatase [Cephalotrichum gorgonifer]|uniref:Related to nucleotide diphosphatase n=1 Tax=Cephalotrichum gorgonifer TaxID=2041049 RepID=A0AAE8SST2_9PEZI|nr:related to nucleotide diphosphatase [Cephalotrichum gorgonifer]